MTWNKIVERIKEKTWQLVCASEELSPETVEDVRAVFRENKGKFEFFGPGTQIGLWIAMIKLRTKM